MSNEPLVSVSMPSYNHARFLPEAIESVLAQTYKNFELIIVDDGSTDNSLEIAQRYAAKHPAVKVYTHPNRANLGISKTSDAAIAKIKGKYWACCCSDDILCSDKLERQVDYMETNPQTALVCGYMDTIDADGKDLPGRIGSDIDAAGDQLASLLTHNWVTAPTMMARREAVEKVGHHEEKLVYSDWELWIRFAALDYKIGFIPHTLVKYRTHGSNASFGIEPSVNLRHTREMYLALRNKSRRGDGGKLGEAKYRRIIEERLNETLDEEARHFLDKYYNSLAAKQWSAAKGFLAKAFKISPQAVLRPRRIASISKQLIVNLLKS